MNPEYQKKYLDKAREIVLRHIDQNKYAVFIFGSWAEKKGKKDSDLDIGVWGREALPYQIKSKISTDFEESIIPWPVDVVDFSRTGFDFNRIALQNLQYWNNPFGQDIRAHLLNKEQADAN